MSEGRTIDPGQAARFLDELTDLSARTLGRPIMVAGDDHAGFMIWNFCTKMTYHARSVRCLMANGLGRDAGVIARTMMEGIGYLNWAMKDKKRPELWRAFFWVEAYRFWQAQAARGRQLSEEHRENLRTMLARYGRSFLRRKRSAMPGLFSPGSEQWFRWDWLPPDQRDEWKKETSALGLDEYFYSAYSRWIHWNCEALAASIDKSEGGWIMSHDDPTQSNAALLIACGSLVPMLARINGHFELGIEQEMQAVERRCIPARPADDSQHRG